MNRAGLTLELRTTVAAVKSLVPQGGDSFLNPGGITIRRWYPFAWPSFSCFISHVVSRARKYCQAGDYNYIQKGAGSYRTE